ncbi:MAG TPA: hypothetical protein VFE65_11110 [Pseudonocardia sp.]|nr:hypothetical protein [Pseudonocardia sp.]
MTVEDEHDEPDLATAFELLRSINRDDAAVAYRLATRFHPDELVVALVEAHLGSLRAVASRELGAQMSSPEVTQRVDERLGEALGDVTWRPGGQGTKVRDAHGH